MKIVFGAGYAYACHGVQLDNIGIFSPAACTVREKPATSLCQQCPGTRTHTHTHTAKVIMKLFDKFQSLAVCNPNRGKTALFWSDIWVDQTMKDKFPQLFSFTRKPKCSVRFFLDQEMDRIFSLPLSQQAVAQLEEIQQLMQVRTWDESISDAWSYCWGSSRYSRGKAYNILISTTLASPLFKWLWASSNLGNHKFFFWLLLRDRLNTRNLLR